MQWLVYLSTSKPIFDEWDGPSAVNGQGLVSSVSAKLGLDPITYSNPQVYKDAFIQALDRHFGTDRSNRMEKVKGNFS